jgi:hypothetical protein
MQLDIQKKTGALGQFPSRGSSLWHGIRKPRDLALRFTQLIQDGCPSLQYIKIGQYCWHVEREIGGDGCATLCALDPDEIAEFELFMIEDIPTYSGLAGRKRFYELDPK